jgi:hypothetical protein
MLWRVRARLDALGQACLVHRLIEQRVCHVHEGERNTLDTVVHVGKVQREGEQVGVHAMPRHGMVWSIGDVGLLQTLSMALGRVPEVQGGTNGDLGSMVEAMIHRILQCTLLTDLCTPPVRLNGRMKIIFEFLIEFWWVVII